MVNIHVKLVLLAYDGTLSHTRTQGEKMDRRHKAGKGSHSLINELALSILDSAPHATFVLENRRIIFANHAVESVFGRKPADLIDKSTRILYSTKKEYEKIGEEVYAALEKERVAVIPECPCRHKDGGVIICRVSAARIGSSLVNKKVVATYENITDAKRIQSRLLESERLYRTLAEASFAGVFLVQNGRFKYLNEHAASYVGYKPEELIGRIAYRLVHAEDRSKVRKYAQAMLKGKRNTPYYYRVLNKAGDIRTIMETITSIAYEGRQAVLGTSMDITEIREAQRKIEEFGELRSSILDSVPHAIMYLEDRIVKFANDAVESVFGWKPDELIGQSTRMLFLSDADFKEMGRWAYSTLQKKRAFEKAEYPYRHKSEDRIYCKIKAVRIGEVLKKRRLIVTYENITEQKRIQEALNLRTKELEQKTQNLEETNIALKVLLKRREADRSEIEESVINNIGELIIPCLQQMKKYRMDDEALKYVAMAESQLTNIVSPFLRKLSAQHLNLTHREVLVASLLRDGKSSKEIADLLNITVSGVEFHRNKIRKKLGLREKENLRSFLLSHYSEDQDTVF